MLLVIRTDWLDVTAAAGPTFVVNVLSYLEGSGSGRDEALAGFSG